MDDAPKSYEDIHGWFQPGDVKLFNAVLESQRDSDPGDLVEIGAFVGKSAVVIGDHLRKDRPEKFVVIDVFGDLSLLGETGSGEENAAESTKYYPRVTRERFEQNYLALHDELPVVVQADSAEIGKYVEPGSARFIHVDGSHVYSAVAVDCRSAKQLLRPGGVVAFDDWRNPKCPGVAAAIWEAVVRDGLIPFATTPSKLYGVYEHHEQAVAVVRELVERESGWWDVEDHEVRGHTLVRLMPAQRRARRAARQQRAQEEKAAAPPAAPAPAPSPPPPSPEGARSIRRILVDDVAPPALTRWARRRRRG